MKLFRNLRMDLSVHFMSFAYRICPDPYLKLWIGRGVNFISTAMKEEMRSQHPLRSLEVMLPAHDLNIPKPTND